MEISFVIPFPPSINRLYKAGKGRFWMDDKGKNYKFSVITHVKKIMAFKKFNGFDKNDLLEISLNQYPETNHRRDIDAGIKIMLDSLQLSGIFDNDRQVKYLKVKMMPKVSKEKGAYVDVTIKSICP